MRKRKTFLWIMAGLLVLVVTAGLILVLVVEHSRSLRQNILARVERSLGESTGAKVEIRDFNLHLASLTLDIYDLVVRGREADSSHPLLQADHVEAGVLIDSFLRRTWHLTSVVIDHPVVHLVINQAGENNLPQSQKKSTSQTSIFDLAIRKFVVDRGEIYYNDQKSPLDVELHDLQLNSAFDPAQSRYYGDLAYRDGNIRYGAYAPVSHNLQTTFAATPQKFTLDKLTLTVDSSRGDSSRIVASASLENYSSPKVQATYEAELVTGDFRRVLKNSSLPTGTVRLTGSLSWQNQPNRPMLETVSVSGQVSSALLDFRTPDLRAAVHNFGARYKLEGGNASVENIHAQLLGGTLDGTLTIHDLAGKSLTKVQAALKGVSIHDLRAAYPGPSMKQTQLSGTINADAQATWAKNMDNLKAHCDALVQAVFGQKPATPLNGVVHADYLAATQEVTLRQSYVRTPQTTINLDGTISRVSQLQVRMNSSNLHELELLAANFAAGKPQPELGLYGSAAFNGTVSGTTKDPLIRGHLSAANLRVKGSSWRTLKTDISASPSSASLTNGELQSATQGSIRFSLQTALKQWVYLPSNPVAIDVSASQLQIADLEKLASLDYPVSGILGINLSIRGSQLNPEGKGNLNVTSARVSGEPIQSAMMNFQGTGDAASANLQIRMPAGVTTANLTYYPKTETYQAGLQASDLHIERLQIVKARNMRVAGGVTVSASGQGSIKNPELTATVRIPQLQVQQQSIKGVLLETTLHNQVATIALNTEVAATYLKASGTVHTNAPYMTDLRVDTGRIAMQPLVALYSPAQAQNINGQTELHVTLRGPLNDKAKLEARLSIPVLAVSYKELQLAASKPILLDYKDGVAVLQPAEVHGTGTELRAQGTMPVTTPDAASFLVQGTLDLRVAQLVQPDLQTSGQIQFDINSQRYSSIGSNLDGQIKIVNANVHTASYPVGLDNANGVINVAGNRLEISQLRADMGGGVVTLTGGATYRPAMQFNLALATQNVRVRYPEGLRAIVGSNLTLTGNTQAAVLNGQVRLEHLSFTPDFDLSEFITQFTGESAVGPPSSFAQSIRLDVALLSTTQMNLASSKVSLQGSANLRLTGTAAAPVILGRSNLTGGEMFFAGNRYVIQHGVVDFLNPVRTQPVVNLQVTTLVDQYNITLNFQGPVDRLVATYTSDPALPPVDIINLLAFGKTTEAAAANPSTPGNLGAQTVLAQGLGEVSNRIEKFAGISHLAIDPALGGDNHNQGPRIAIQQRVTSNLLVTFATDVTSTQRQVIQMEYKLNKRWSLSGVRDQNGGLGIDTKFHKEF
ncbi:MAG TPA: translocation/assembly module TamB domain-containing protein [Candidatus Angelobacter sp.]|nr:translocation/assembly module TamB domain-containing protein [Candidatus Angelobacter sp.]